MSVVMVTGSAGLVGSEAADFFCNLGYTVVGLDNDMRGYFFGREASNQWKVERLRRDHTNYIHYDVDIRDQSALERIFRQYAKDLVLVVHTAAQPSHDWAAKEPLTDFTINATATLLLLESCRQFAPEAVFVFTSTNKVYGDLPNTLPLIELDTRWEIDRTHQYRIGIDETMSIDASKHSLFGASKVAADVLVQEYGRYFGMRTACFRAGCITGPNHSGAQLHGFLSYLMKCVIAETPYTIIGYKGKQVRDHIHSYDLVNAFYHFFQEPRVGEVYNMGGSRENSCSTLEAVNLCEELTGKRLISQYAEQARIGDHIWWISDISKFRLHYPGWNLRYSLREIAEQIVEVNNDRWTVLV
jgi:CDP-paratose 2-epimerase